MLFIENWKAGLSAKAGWSVLAWYTAFPERRREKIRNQRQYWFLTARPDEYPLSIAKDSFEYPHFVGFLLATQDRRHDRWLFIAPRIPWRRETGKLVYRRQLVYRPSFVTQFSRASPRENQERRYDRWWDKNWKKNIATFFFLVSLIFNSQVVISAVSFSTQRIVFSESAVFFGVITEVHVAAHGVLAILLRKC